MNLGMLDRFYPSLETRE
jgi:hypothetical protein